MIGPNQKLSLIMHLAEESQSEKDKYGWYRLYAESKKNDTNEIISKQKQTHKLREHFHGSRGERLGLWDGHLHTALLKIDNQ